MPNIHMFRRTNNDFDIFYIYEFLIRWLSSIKCCLRKASSSGITSDLPSIISIRSRSTSFNYNQQIERINVYKMVELSVNWKE